MKTRIEEILLKYRLSSAQFADLVGVQRSSISHILSGRNKPSFDFIEKILVKYPEINADWLITGRGSLIIQENTTNRALHTTNESDLFKQTPNNQQFTQKTTQSVFKPKEADIESETTKTIDAISKITNVNSVKSIVLIYNDDSFKILNSR